MTEQNGTSACRELFHLTFWLARTYARKAAPEASLSFEPGKPANQNPVKMAQIAEQATRLLKKFKENNDKLADREETIEAQKAELEAQDQRIEDLLREIAEAKAANNKRPDSHDYHEEETRDQFIDLFLQEVGWKLDREQDREFPVTGMPTDSGQGYVDYVLRGDDGKPLALVEAKRTRRSAQAVSYTHLTLPTTPYV